MQRVFFLNFFTLLFSFAAVAQEIPEYENLEQGFELMRQRATDGDYESAKLLGYKILEEKEEQCTVV